MAIATVFKLTTELAIERSRTKTNDRLLMLLSILGFTIVSAFATMALSGTYMFHQRYTHPRGNMAAAIAMDPSFAIIPQTYFSLAVFACVLIVIPACSLASQAAIITAQSQHYRLGVLRLIGLNRRDVNVMGTCEVLAQGFIGIVVGQVLALLAAPLFTHLAFQGMPVAIDELYMPWYFYVLADATLLIFILIATVMSLSRVSISPLGVVKRNAAKPLRAWRLLVLVAVIALVALLPTLSKGQSRFGAMIISIAVVTIILLVNDIIGPFILQLLARPLTLLPGFTLSWATRRILFNPRQVWRRISGISFLVFLATFVSYVKIAPGDDLSEPAQSVTENITRDLSLGLLIVIVVTSIINAISVMVAQISAEFSRADNTRDLKRMGVPARTILAVNWIENIVPFVAATLSSWLLGSFAGGAFINTNDYHLDNPQSVGGPLVIVSAIIIGTVLLIVAQLLSMPVFTRIFHSTNAIRA
ncbi:FtsX-like permease family [Corynebacterium renale]|uniref:FtsX-like permease family protein n=1 Tax=Corynebacterium renale TaxID=1724 RepID=UPI000DA414A5|nr:FtsX-like permease family protein [Corynebacterium renale]SQG65168.1 FtsX-like permease family [Corynebacterium renale]STC98164.1 FtsX-like permease family [Corynebacterium renale]